MWHKNDEILRHTRAQQRRQPGDEIPKAPGAHRIEGMNNSTHSSGTQNSRTTQNSSGNTTRSSQQQQYGRVTPPPPSPSPSSNGRRCLHEEEQQEDFNPYPLRYESYQPPRSFATTTTTGTASINTSVTSGSTPPTTSAPLSPTREVAGASSPPPRHVRPRHQQQRKNLNDLEEEHSRSPKQRTTAGGGGGNGSGKNYHPHQYHQDDHHQKPNTTSSEEGNKYIHHHDDLVAGTAEIDADVTATAHHHHASAQPDGSGITDSFINRQRNAGINIVEATLVENEDEIAEKMKQKEEELLQRLAAKDAELKAKDAELRRVQQEREQQQRRSTQQQQQQQAPAAGLGGGAGVTFSPGTTTHRKAPSHRGGGGETSSVASSELSMDRAEFMRNRILQRDEVKLGRVISTGSFNSVYNIKSIKLDEQSYRWVPREHIQQRQHIVEMAKYTKLALKSLDPNLDSKKRPLASKRLLYEAKLLITKLNDHPNIIKILGTASQDVADTNFFFIIPKSDYTLYDAINGGNKWNKRQKGKPKFLFSTQVKAAIDIASGLDHLHSLNIMCSDLKPENIGYTMESNSWKLCNLSKAQSLARKAKSRGMGHQRQPAMKPYNMDLRTSSLYHGTPPYAAPEISEKIPCNIAVDTFSLAIVLWEITSVRLCFGRESKTLSALTSVVVDEATSGAKWQRPGFDKDAPKALQEIIQQCWEDDPRYRPYMKDVLSKLKFFQETLSAVL